MQQCHTLVLGKFAEAEVEGQDCSKVPGQDLGPAKEEALTPFAPSKHCQGTGENVWGKWMEKTDCGLEQRSGEVSHHLQHTQSATEVS